MTHPPEHVLLVVAVFSRHAEALTWARERLQSLHGPIALTSPDYEFTQTSYYEPTMGPHLIKRFHAFGTLVHPDRLAEIKERTNELECELAAGCRFSEPRPLNLDPGFLSLGKFCLATTKDQAHRLYLRNGIFAEVTLRFEAGAFEPWPWTYADYRQPVVRAFLKEARDFYKGRLRFGANSPAAGTTT
jgi:hypothetical protein